jgi:quinol monooxygenase YgiN
LGLKADKWTHGSNGFDEKEADSMIHVIARIELKQDSREKFLEIFRKNVPNVRAEKGCIHYEPTVDINSGLPAQGEVRPNVVTVVEAWESLDALHTHLKAPHMLDYRDKVKDLVKQVSLQVLEPA